MTERDFDSLSREHLVDRGSVKWSMFPGTIGAFVAEMDFGLAPAIVQALHNAVDRAVTGYLPVDLVEQLRTSTVAWYSQTYGWQVPPERVHPVPDVVAAFEQTIRTFSDPGTPVIVPTPAYMPFLAVPPMHGREVIEVPSLEVDGRMLIDLDAVERAFAAGAQLLVFCNPHNPLGTVSRPEEMAALAEVVDRCGGRVFSDEIHAPLVYPGAKHVPYASISPAAAGHTITATSASKAWNLAGLKCAQVVLSNDADQQIWERMGVMAGHGTANFGAIANTAAYTAGRRWLDHVLEYLDGNRRLLAELVEQKLPGVRVTLPEGTYIAWMDFRATGIEGDLGAWFREHAGVAMTDGRACGEIGAGHTRFVFALPRPLLVEAIDRIAEALSRHESTVEAAPVP